MYTELPEHGEQFTPRAFGHLVPYETFGLKKEFTMIKIIIYASLFIVKLNKIMMKSQKLVLDADLLYTLNQ